VVRVLPPASFISAVFFVLAFGMAGCASPLPTVPPSPTLVPLASLTVHTANIPADVREAYERASTGKGSLEDAARWNAWAATQFAIERITPTPSLTDAPVHTATVAPVASLTPSSYTITGRVLDLDVKYFLQKDAPVFAGYVSNPSPGNPAFTYREVKVQIFDRDHVIASVDSDTDGNFDFRELEWRQYTILVTTTMDYADMVDAQRKRQVCQEGPHQVGPPRTTVRALRYSVNIDITVEAIGCKPVSRTVIN